MEKEESQIKSPDGVKYLQAVEEEMWMDLVDFSRNFGRVFGISGAGGGLVPV
jgi:hypothetical protein